MQDSTPSDAAGQQSRYLQTLERLLAIQAISLKSALDEASTRIALAVKADKVDAFLYDPLSESLVAVGTSDTPMGQRQIAIGMNRLPLANGGRAVQTFQTGQTYHTGHVDTDLEELRGIREGLGIRSAIHIPLSVGGERRGVIQVDSAQHDAFLEEDVTFLQAVTHWMGLVVQRGELVERLTQEAAEEAQRRSAEEIITILAHDLRNYLTPLLSRSMLLQERAAREGAHGTLSSLLC